MRVRMANAFGGRLSNTERTSFVFEPEDWLPVIVEMLVVAGILYDIMCTPFRAAFQIRPTSTWVVMDVLTDL